MDWHSFFSSLWLALQNPAAAAELSYLGFKFSVWLQWAFIACGFAGAVAISPFWKSVTLSTQETLNSAFKKQAICLPALLLTAFGRALLEATGHTYEITDFAVAFWSAICLWQLVGALNLNRRPTLILRLVILLVVAFLFTDRWHSIITLLSSTSLKLGQFNLSLWSISKAFLVVGFVFWAINHGNQFLTDSLGRTRLQPAARTLIVKLVNILAIAFAILVGLDMLGIDFAALAVFGGAFGLGLGFGMRSIISNYIAGIILLMDRSLKPGDVIDVEGIYGVIAEMNARFVVVRPRNSADILIPNEQLLTNQVTNWSYRSRAIRQSIEFGVSYNTDMEKISDIVTEAVQDHPRVLERPKPRCFIVEFGESSVNFELRFWMNDPENGVKVLKGDLYMRVWKALKANNIEIPFPQRVVHMVK
jgi:small-conductance mechanosensitive channel